MIRAGVGGLTKALLSGLRYACHKKERRVRETAWLMIILTGGGISGVRAADSVTVNFTTSVVTPTCALGLSTSKPALKDIQLPMTSSATQKVAHLGTFDLKLSGCSGTLDGSGKALKVTLSGNAIAGSNVFRDAAAADTRLGFVLQWNSAVSPATYDKINWSTATAQTWPGSLNADLTTLTQPVVPVAVGAVAAGGAGVPGVVSATVTFTLQIQ